MIWELPIAANVIFAFIIMNKKEEEKLRKIVEENYRTIASHYSETRKKRLWNFLFDICSAVKSGDKVLDVGCGSGKLLQALSEKNINYLGIDPSKALLLNAKKNFKNFKFEPGSLEDLSACDGDYDFVFCIAVLQHIPGRENRIKAIKNLGGKINSSGKVIISVWDLRKNHKYGKMILKNNLRKLFFLNKMDFGDLVFDWKNNRGEKISKRYYHAYSLLELKKDCLAAGLSIDKLFRADNNIYAILSKR